MMRTILLSCFFILLSFSLLTNTAEARRFGGGKSFGFSRPARSFSNASSVAPARTFNSPSKRNRWLAPLAGLALGGLLASLFMGHGMGAGMLSWIMVAGALFLVWQLLARFRQKPSLQTFQAESPNPSQYAQPLQSHTIPTEAKHFDVNAFLRQAKATFIRLQAAYDTKNLEDIRTFTTPQVFAEIQIQFHERQDAPNHTEVISLDAELLDHAIESEQTISVVFSGLIREAPNAKPDSMKEIWHFMQSAGSLDWQVSGIQQVS